MRLLSLKQQAQLLSSTAAHKVVESSDSFESIEEEMETLATSLHIEGCVVELERIDSEVVKSMVTIDFSKNSPLSSLLNGKQVSSAYHSFREESIDD